MLYKKREYIDYCWNLGEGRGSRKGGREGDRGDVEIG